MIYLKKKETVLMDKILFRKNSLFQQFKTLEV
jgi:hypothetical protein